MKKVKIGLLGFGTVGQGVKQILDLKNENLRESLAIDFEIKKILVRDLNKKRDVEVDSSILTEDVADILEDKDIDVIVEVTGGDTYEVLLEALDKGKDVVTANKATVSKYFQALHQAAADRGRSFAYEASVGGGIPVIKPLYDLVKINEISQVSGILNGTSNYILTHMTKGGRDYSDVLKEAQDLGYAEADPYDDVEGPDAMRKLKILSSIAFRTDLDEKDIFMEGISKITAEDIRLLKERNLVVKLICSAVKEEDQLTLSVMPTAIKDGSYYSVVNEALNSISVYSDMQGQARFYGPGAGRLPTANAVVTDLIDIALDNDFCQPDLSRNLDVADDFEASFYVRTSEDLGQLVEEDLGQGAYITKVVNYRQITELIGDGNLIRIEGES